MKIISRKTAEAKIANGARYAYCPTGIGDAEGDFRPFFFATRELCDANRFVAGGRYVTATYVVEEALVRGEFKNHNGNYLPCMKQGHKFYAVKGG